MSSNRLFLIFGTDEYQVSAKAKSLLKDMLPDGHSGLQCERFDGSVDKVDAALKVISRVRMALVETGLFSEEKVVWLENATFLGDNRTGQSSSVQEALTTLTQSLKKGLPLGVTLIISAASIDKRRAFYKTCQSTGEIFEFSIPDDRYAKDHTSMNARFEEFLKEKGLTMTPSARDAFQQKVGPETRLILNELEKLAVALNGSTKVSAEDVAEHVSASREAAFWDLADAFARRDLGGALKTLRQLIFQRQNMIGLISNLEHRIRDLLIYREAIDRQWLKPKSVYGNPGYAWSNLPPEAEYVFTQALENDPRKIHPFRVSILGTQAAAFTRKRLDYCLRQVTQAHEQMVSSRVPPELIMEILILRMLGSAKRRT